MKKIIKVLILASAMTSLMGFIGCKPTSTDTTKKNNTNKNTLNTDDDEDDDDDDTVGAIPFKKFGGCDIQIWCRDWGGGDNSLLAESEEVDDALCFTPSNGGNSANEAGYWVAIFVDKADGSGTTFDMSSVKYITFDAKASRTGQISVGGYKVAGNIADDTKITLDTDWNETPYTLKRKKGGDEELGVFALGVGGPFAAKGANALGNFDDEIYIRNIAFFNADDEEIVPVRN